MAQDAAAEGAVNPPVLEYPEPFWRSLFFFNVYRLVVALILVTIALVWRNTFQFGARDLTLFLATAGVYSVFSVASFVAIRSRRRFNLQLTVQVAADVVFIVLLIYASDGLSSGLGLLLLSTLAGAGLISRGRLTLFHAALASIGVLLEHTYEVLHFDAYIAQFVQAGLLSSAYFATAWVAHTLAKYTSASEQLAAQREIDLENMAQVNQHVIQDMQDGVVVVDGNGIIRQFNARAERLLGPVVGRRDVRLDDYAPALGRRYAQWREGESADLAGGAVALSRTVRARFVPVGVRRAAGAVIFLEDQTRIQSEARQMKLAAIGRLTANIAHEIRNPLGAISHAAELLQEEPAVSATSKRLATIIHDNTRRLDRMVNGVLALNRDQQANREKFRLVPYLTAFIDQFSEVEKADYSTFALEFRADPEVLFDRTHLDQVLWNLCRNALRHCRKERGSIRIAVTPEPAAGAVKLEVIDDGPGVAPEMRSRLFEPFVTTAPGGNGLGLYIAREVCEANGATLDYVETGAGAQFTVVCRAG